MQGPQTSHPEWAPALTCMVGLVGMYRAGSVGWRSVGVWMRDDDREWDDPIIDALGQPAEDVNAFLEVIRRLLGRTLLYMSLDAVQLADVAPHSEF